MNVNGTERYLRQATRGLSGQARRDAQTELRGAIEDKAWRLTLLGMEPDEASRAALRDLGSPHAIASGLTRVHTLPKAALAAVLAGVSMLLGVQALAAVPVVRAIQDPTYKFCVYDEATLKAIKPIEAAARLRLQIALPGGRAKAEADCRANSPVPFNEYLRFSDLTQAFRAGGIGVRTLPELDGFLYLTIPGHGPERVVNLSDFVTRVAGQPYVPIWLLVSSLRLLSDVPVRLTGTVNPVLEIGSAKLQLGTKETPVQAVDVYTAALFEILNSELIAGAGVDMKLAAMMATDSDLRNQIGVNGPEESSYVTVSNEDFIFTSPGVTSRYLMRVMSVKNGRLSAPFAVMAKGSIVNTPKELINATKNIRPAVLVYRLDTSDLRNLKLTPVPASQLRGLQAR